MTPDQAAAEARSRSVEFPRDWSDREVLVRIVACAKRGQDADAWDLVAEVERRLGRVSERAISGMSQQELWGRDNGRSEP